LFQRGSVHIQATWTSIAYICLSFPIPFAFFPLLSHSLSKLSSSSLKIPRERTLPTHCKYFKEALRRRRRRKKINDLKVERKEKRRERYKEKISKGGAGGEKVERGASEGRAFRFLGKGDESEGETHEKAKK